MDGKELDDLLEKTFSNVNSWLKRPFQVLCKR